MSDPLRALLDDLENDDEEAQPRESASALVLPLTRLQRILQTPCVTFGDMARVMGTHYRFLMSSEVYAHDEVNHVDLMWLQVAEKMAERAPPTPVMTAATLRETVRARLHHAFFALEMLRCRRENILSRTILPMLWRTLKTLCPEKNPEHRDVLRSCSRWIGAMCFAHVYVIGPRAVEVVAQPHPNTSLVEKDLQHLLKNRAQTLPEVFHDGLLGTVRAAHLPVDAAVFYEAIHPSHGECDLHLALKAAVDLDVKTMDALCRWVPWPRPVLKAGESPVGLKPADIIEKPPRWLVELWQLRVFGFFFHSAFSDSTGYVPQLGSEGLFFERYVVSWWELMLPSGVVKLETSKRFHVPALPLIIPISRTQVWLRTTTHVYVHSTFASALAAWLEMSSLLEDGVHVWAGCKSFMPSLPDALPDAVVVNEDGESFMDMEEEEKKLAFD